MRTLLKLASGACLLLAGPSGTALAADGDLVDLSSAAKVAAALQTAGYRAEVKTGDDGEPYVLSSAGGQAFSIDLYDCTKNEACGSFQIRSNWKAEPLFTAALANEWNRTKRQPKVYVDSEGRLQEEMNVSSTGRLTEANFKDWIAWYESADKDLATFLEQHRAGKKDGASTSAL